MTQNGPAGMYRVKPLYDSNPRITLPTCMYKVKNIFEESTCSTSVSTAVENEDTAELIKLEQQQLQALKLLENMKSQLMEMKKELNISDSVEEIKLIPKPMKYQDIVIKANPSFPPLSIWAFYHLLTKTMQVRLVSYFHSSLTDVPEYLTLLQSFPADRLYDISLTIIWRGTGKDAEMIVSPVYQGIIEGEVNIVRYLCRLLSFGYDEDPITSALIDSWLEMAHSCIIHGNNKEKQAALRNMNSSLSARKFLVGDKLSVADIILWSALIQTKLHQNLPSHVTKWWKLLQSSPIFINARIPLEAF